MQTQSLSTSTPTLATPDERGEAQPPVGGFVERRSSRQADTPQRSGGAERRQFGSSHVGLSEEGRELALAIDRYKLERHRKYITCDEMLYVLRELGYRRST
jgi:hypothetical protein